MPQTVQASFCKAKLPNAEQVRFEIVGGDCRLIAAFDFRREVALIKFLWTYVEYERIDALTVNQTSRSSPLPARRPS